MLQTITEEELEFLETLYYSPALVECLFNDFDNLGDFQSDKFGNVRLGQLPLLSYEYILDDDPKLSAKENYRLREGAGNIFCFGGRLFGKTLCVETLDVPCELVLGEGVWIGFTSLDQMHIRGVVEKIIIGFENHAFLKAFNVKINRSPNYRFACKNGFLLESVNMNIQSPKPGAQFFQKHFKKLYIEEASFETDEI